MGKRMKIDTSMKVFARMPLHQRTVDSWASAVIDPRMLTKLIREELQLWDKANTGGIYFRAETPAGIPYLLDSILLAGINAEITTHFSRGSGTRIHGWSWEMMSLTTVAQANESWEYAEGLKLMLLLSTYRVLMAKEAGKIPGLDGNITIPGAVFTAMKLGAVFSDD